MATLDNTIGSSFVGVVAAAVLFGVSCVQTWFYFSRYGSTDVWYIKALVLVCLTFDTLHQTLISHTVYWYTISNFNNPGALSMLVWSILLEVLFNGLIGLIVQGFLTLRVFRRKALLRFSHLHSLLVSNGNIGLTVTAGSLVLAEFGCSVAFTIQSMKLETWKELGQLKPLSMTVNVLAAVSDLVIAMILVYYLRRSKTGFKKSDTMISKLIVFSVSTGLLTSVCAIGSLILVWGETLIYVTFYFVVGRLYFNSVLATLNARKVMLVLARRIKSWCNWQLKDILTEDPEDLSFSLQTMSKAVPRNMSSIRRPTISIKIDTTHEVEAEQYSERSCNLQTSTATSQEMDC
ncbi:hypothetical protein C8F01DRAFT_1246510 [Mycena amicta]|nr:hypothetical protein C8F01DRAFT_1246510 [Mycena amicta]